jgi:hypothetical protein
LTLEYRPAAPQEEEYQILINGKSVIGIEEKEGTRGINLKQPLEEEDFILALEEVHARVYGKAYKPLKLSLSKELLEKRRVERESAPAVILPQKNATEIKSTDRAILLPDFKADTTIISP